MQTLRPVSPEVERLLEEPTRPCPRWPSLAEDGIAVAERLVAFARILVTELVRDSAVEDALTVRSILAVVAQRPRIMSGELRGALTISRARANRCVRQAARAGLIEARRSRDRRGRELLLTEAGRRLAEDHRLLIEAFADSLLGKLGPEGRSRLRSVSRELVVGVEESRARRLARSVSA